MNSGSNIASVRKFYEAYGRGDGETALSLMAKDIAWFEAEGHPFADGNPYIGPQAVLAGVFQRVADTWSQDVEVNDVFAADNDRVIVYCRYKGKNIQTKKAINVQVIHIWTVKYGKLSRFEQYADTNQIVDSTIP